eukprot:scaffold4.g4763.t1
MTTMLSAQYTATGARALRGAPARRALGGQRLRQRASNGSRCNAFFKFRSKDDAPSEYHEFHTPEHREDYTAAEVKEYFSYMGMLAEDGTYDRLDAMLASGKHPADLLLLMASYENDEGKVEELLEAGADVTIQDEEGRTPLELTSKEYVKELLRRKLESLTGA